jgi:uncharacterized membrane protein YjfL (UPF0719 family)
MLNKVAISGAALPASTHIALIVPLDQLATLLALTLIFTLAGLILFALAFWIMGRVTPFSIRKEIEEDHNTALAIVMGSVILGIALIVASAVHG